MEILIKYIISNHIFYSYIYLMKYKYVLDTYMY